jgi:ethanolamine utilization protein EutA
VPKVTALIENWLKQSGVKIDAIFSGGSMITGLAAQADNAQALTQIITNIVGESVIATAADPCLESWLAFKGSCAALSRYHADAPILNFDIGGGTANIALGINGDVQQTGCYFIGARHFQLVAGSYKLSAMSSYGETLLEALTIKKVIGETFNEDEIAKIMAFYVNALEAICLGNTDFFNAEIAKKHCQAAIKISPKAIINITFSGGVGELIYKISANELLPTTTFYGDFGIDLARAISRSSILSANLKTHIPEHKGRATVVGLTLHSTEMSGNSIYLPNPNCLPLRDVPIVAKISQSSTATQWQSAFTLAANCPHGACIQISADNKLEQIRSLATQIRHGLQANTHEASSPLILLIDSNIGKALGNYICDWGQLDYNLMVIDEVALRDAQFINIGRLHQQMIPVSFYGLN